MAMRPSLTKVVLWGGSAICAVLYVGWKRKKGKDKFEVPSDLLTNSGEYNEELKLAVSLAVAAGTNMVRHYESKGTSTNDDLGIIYKNGRSDFATKIDTENETFILNAIRERFPDHEVIGEESTGSQQTRPLTKLQTWIVDPIDGTTNFAAGLPLTCVSIGMCHLGVPVLGVVFSPFTNELYAAVKNRGAYRNNVRLSLSSGVRLGDAVVCFEFGYEGTRAGVVKMLSAVERILLHGCRCLRSLGSGVLDLCYVASGRLDVVYTGLAGEGWKPWDYCAAMVVVEEAGGVIRSLKGQQGVFDIYDDSMICAGNQVLLDECRTVVLGSSKKDSSSVTT